MQGYHDEFLSHKQEFSESWRAAAEEMDRTNGRWRTDSDATSANTGVVQFPSSTDARTGVPMPSVLFDAPSVDMGESVDSETRQLQLETGLVVR